MTERPVWEDLVGVFRLAKMDLEIQRDPKTGHIKAARSYACPLDYYHKRGWITDDQHSAGVDFGELWQAPGLGGVIEDVYRSGEPFLEAETQVSLDRGGAGRVEQASFTRGHSVVRDRHGTVVGVLTVAAETTQVTRRLQQLYAKRVAQDIQ